MLTAVARVALAVMLFTQAALAFTACESTWRTPALALAEKDAGKGCHEQDINLNLCLVHCLGNDQSLDKPLVTLPALVAAPPLLVLTVPVSPPELRAPRLLAVARAAGPPPRILFQSFLI